MSTLGSWFLDEAGVGKIMALVLGDQVLEVLGRGLSDFVNLHNQARGGVQFHLFKVFGTAGFTSSQADSADNYPEESHYSKDGKAGVHRIPLGVLTERLGVCGNLDNFWVWRSKGLLCV